MVSCERSPIVDADDRHADEDQARWVRTCVDEVLSLDVHQVFRLMPGR